MISWTIIADDLTGACDTGVAFARRGMPTRVAFTPEADFSGAQVRVVTTESRALSQEECIQAVERAVYALGLSEADGIYKKIDSTLRGHPGVELAAVMNAAGIKRALVSLAFPEQGRVVRDGRVFVNGTSLEKTSFGREIIESNLLRLFETCGKAELIPLEYVRQGVERVVERIERSPAVVMVTDAETDGDLHVLAQAGIQAKIGLLCGSAGLARGLVSALPVLEECLIRRQEEVVSFSDPVLVVSGSYHPIARRQVQVAVTGAAVGISLLPGSLRVATKRIGLQPGDLESDAPASLLKNSGKMARSFLRQGNNVILFVVGADVLAGQEIEIGAGLAIITAEALADTRIGGLVLTGGETAMRVCQALGCMAIDLSGEIRPGVAWGRLASGPFAGVRVVTKAGGFGDENMLVEAIRFLRRD